MTEMPWEPYSLDSAARLRELFVLDQDNLDHVLRAAGVRLQPLPANGGRNTWTIVDTFDWRLLRSGSVAALLDGQLQLLLAGTAPAQPSPEQLMRVARSPVPKLAEVTVPQRLRRKAESRALLELGRRSLSRKLYEIRNREAKLLGFQESWLIEGRSPLAIVRVHALRGFGRDLCTWYGESEVGAVNLVGKLAAPIGRAPGDYNAKVLVTPDPTQSIHDAYRGLVLMLTGVMQAAVPGIRLRLDIEFLHDFRVAFRALRSLIKDVAIERPSESLQAQLRALATLTGAARDLDVAILDQSTEPDRQIAVALGAHRARLEAECERRYAELIAYLDVWDTGAFVKALLNLELPAGTVGEHGARVTQRRRRSLSKARKSLATAYKRRGAAVPDEQIHDVRIKGKRMRYTQELFGGSSSRSMRRFQDRLGDYNDLVVSEERLKAQAEMSEWSDHRVSIGYQLARVQEEKRTARESVLDLIAKGKL